MPHRLVSLAILVFWAVAAAALFGRDILPDLIVGPPPDLKALTTVGDQPRHTRWTILVEEDRIAPGQYRSVGRVETTTRRKKDESTSMISDVWFDSGDLMRGTPFAAGRGERLEVRSVVEVDPLGNLQYFRSAVRSGGDPTDLLVLEGQLKKDAIEVRARGPLPLINWTRRFPYRAREALPNTLNPFDRMPDLQVGQRWENRVVSPLTGQVENVRVRVARRGVLIHWDKTLVPTMEVVTEMGGTTARTWVRQEDGLVLRQEVPFLFVKLVLERDPSEGGPRGMPR